MDVDVEGQKKNRFLCIATKSSGHFDCRFFLSYWKLTPQQWTRLWFQTFFVFTPISGEWSNLANIFQMRWNHQPDEYHYT